MARLDSPHVRSFCKRDFELFPVWVWDDENEGFLPLSITDDYLSEYGTLFIKARFKTNSYFFDGYLAGTESFYAFGIFFEDRQIIFNLNMQDEIDSDVRDIFNILKCKPFNFFPLYYDSSVTVHGKTISGCITNSLRNRRYISFDQKESWPAGDDLFYECLQCHSILTSIENNKCLCLNLYIDASSGKIGAKDPTKIRLFQEKKIPEKNL